MRECGCSMPSIESSVENFRRRRPIQSCAPAAHTLRSAGKITLATSDWLPFEEDLEKGSENSRPLFDLPDAAARQRAVDPSHNVVLEASAGTGKTHVLVDRYLNLLSRGVDPANVLAITFTRKAAAEMRGRILAELRKRAESGGADQKQWREMRERSGDIAI